MLRKIGIKDRNYYYKPIRNLRGEVVFSHPLDVGALKQAVKQALEIYPHFAVRPVIRDGILYYEENTAEMPVLPQDGKSRYLGSDETNGYLFYIAYGEDRFLISSFHGLADHGGFTPFFMNILYYYITACGGVVPDIRTYESETDESDAFFPYEKYADATAEATWEYTDPAPVFICPAGKEPESDAPAHSYRIHVSAGRFVELTHEWETSFVPAMTSLISGSIADVYGVTEESIVAYTTVDMRSVFGSKNQTNFSEVLVMAMNPELRAQEPKKQCRKLREMIDTQKTKEHLSRIMAALISAVRHQERTPDPDPCVVKLPIPTYLLTYPGRVEFPEGYESWIRELNFGGANDRMGRGLAVMVKTTGDDMLFEIAGVIDIEPICRKLADKLSELGFEPELTYQGETMCDGYSLDKLKRY